ncbi:sporulation protein YqfD [Thalassobacillus sp. CUG 92003]|uniref:sporulation protein YqfD n=1 Tax=Thalassobacillus sp. CUG 92003 TaxID=2736641 RepID=UPI0015E7930D|nr:sporulation protein YqfD [Thalassobacillus sp. CUG 92003]
MNLLQGRFLQGTIVLKVKGAYPESFLNACSKHGVRVWGVRWKNEHEITLTIYSKDLRHCRAFRKTTRCKLYVKNKDGFPFVWQQFMNRKPLWFAVLIFCTCIYLLSNMIWSIQIQGLTPELEAQVEKELNKAGISTGRFVFSGSNPNDIQRHLLEEIPDLLWIGVEKKGTSFNLHGVEKTLAEKDIDNHPSNVVAKKQGVIVKMFISEGRPLVGVNDFVRKGDILASGKLTEDSDTFIRAEGDVIAETWYRAEISVPLTKDVHITTGDTKRKYFLKWNDVELPVWGFGKVEPRYKRVETNEKTFKIFSWEVPIKWKATKHYHIEKKEESRSKEEAVQAGVEQAKHDLMDQLPAESKIVGENILHQREESGKVKLILLLKVNENIASIKNVS